MRYGGSSLGPEVIALTYKKDIFIFDSTDPNYAHHAIGDQLSNTVVVVSSKSGSTIETSSQRSLFQSQFEAAGLNPTDHLVFVTDPGSPLDVEVRAGGYSVINADPNVGGRFSVLSAFGLVPSALAGAPIAEILSDASAEKSSFIKDEQGILDVAYLLVAEPEQYIAFTDAGSSVPGLSDWIEQLIAESTGKLGKGILPVVVGKSADELNTKASDELVVRVVAEATESAPNEVSVSGTLGAQFMLWEYATVVASRLIGINPFDQPDVESAKIAARGMLESRTAESEPDFIDAGIEVRAHGFELGDAKSIDAALKSLLSQLADNGYLSVHAYLDREGVPEAANLRDLLAEATSRPTTFGWAPRFLHSTGQYHKGGPAQGVYLQIVSRASVDLAVPGRDFTLGELIASQASGDAKVLADHGRPVLTLTLSDALAGLKLISESI